MVGFVLYLYSTTKGRACTPLVTLIYFLVHVTIVGAVEEVGVKVPVVVRLEGNNAEIGAKLLDESGLNIIAVTSLSDAAQQVVKAVEGA